MTTLPLKILFAFLAVTSTFKHLYDFVKVGILNNYNGFQFGNVNETSWYYSSAETFSYVNFFFGVGYLFFTVLGAYYLIKKNDKLFDRTSSAVVILIILNTINNLF